MSKWEFLADSSAPPYHQPYHGDPSPMARPFPTFPESVWLEVALCSPLAQILVLLRLGPTVYRALVHLLYRRIRVTVSAPLLVDTLASNLSLPPLVSSLLHGRPHHSCGSCPLGAILPRLENLKTLVVAPSAIPMPLEAIPLIKFHLSTFHAITAIEGPWVDFIAACPSLESIVLHGDFHGQTPSSRALRNLRSIQARPEVIARFASRDARLTEAWFFMPESMPLVSGHLYTKDLKKFTASPSCLETIRACTADLLLLIAAAPGVLHTLRSIVVDEDLTWSEFKLKYGPPLTKNALTNLAKSLDRTFIHLRRLFLVCSQTYLGRCRRPLLTRKDARCFANIMHTYSSAPFLHTFHFAAVDSYVGVMRWGGLDERMEYVDADAEWDEVYSLPAVIFRLEDYAYLFP
ncbi:hypothetical protein MSAN_00441700 [Mycena sanguinolenta]|uniref:Uncharacterized protein n=1 Tax=Mycena sanguinolenta TaxID=230812 RepID=A0A8H7DIH2_9AGAR|nr:hypothetical protein MSAN_00441700 [Mycena sanguinolenta]